MSNLKPLPRVVLLFIVSHDKAACAQAALSHSHKLRVLSFMSTNPSLFFLLVLSEQSVQQQFAPLCDVTEGTNANTLPLPLLGNTHSQVFVSVIYLQEDETHIYTDMSFQRVPTDVGKTALAHN